MKEYMREDKPILCYFHPKEVFVGVCPWCLNERLLILAAKQGYLSQLSHKATNIIGTSSSVKHSKPSFSTLPKIFALGSLLNRKQFDNCDGGDASASPEDSFISIKFEDNGVASWEKGKVSKVSLDPCNISWNHHSLSQETKEANSIVDHVKRSGSLRWRKRIGHLFQLPRWKRSTKGSACHVGSKPEVVKVRSGWIRTLTKRRTKE